MYVTGSCGSRVVVKKVEIVKDGQAIEVTLQCVHHGHNRVVQVDLNQMELV